MTGTSLCCCTPTLSQRAAEASNGSDRGRRLAGPAPRSAYSRRKGRSPEDERAGIAIQGGGKGGGRMDVALCSRCTQMAICQFVPHGYTVMARHIGRPWLPGCLPACGHRRREGGEGGGDSVGGGGEDWFQKCFMRCWGVWWDELGAVGWIVLKGSLSPEPLLSPSLTSPPPLLSLSRRLRHA
ncbi:uncharacterized protein LY79DRAFT_554753 [Colletotrichum navitas]|uniref:Uncharacterized protein n=1 Tax=Colletotrichum navitas TaxID=681940 RepID=A0AAD8PYW7_9PEZI|nr:uncharacterized protein LY79DRAFT_554753 [Colletotrichum navitas]KAK1590481.1 hypothetical protein LY79DRAFT_554753 [Colletotrichum navitas]